MAKQTGDIFITGTLGNVTFYKMNGRYYLKTVSAHSRKRILSDPCFAKTRRNAASFGSAQKMASFVYRLVPSEDRDRKKVWYPLRNRAQELVRSEMKQEEVVEILINEFIDRDDPEIAGIPVTAASLAKVLPGCLNKYETINFLSRSLRIKRNKTG